MITGLIGFLLGAGLIILLARGLARRSARISGGRITLGPGAKIFKAADGSVHFVAGSGNEGGGDITIKGGSN